MTAERHIRTLFFFISDLALYNSHLVKRMREKFQKRKTSAFSSNIVILYSFVLLAVHILIIVMILSHLYILNIVFQVV